MTDARERGKRAERRRVEMYIVVRAEEAEESNHGMYVRKDLKF